MRRISKQAVFALAAATMSLAAVDIASAAPRGHRHGRGHGLPVYTGQIIQPAPREYSYYATEQVHGWQPVTRTYQVPVRGYQTVQRTQYVPVMGYQTVQTAQRVPVVTYQTVIRQHQVPVVYRQPVTTTRQVPVTYYQTIQRTENVPVTWTQPVATHVECD